MNVIFLTSVRIVDIEERGIYNDLMRKFRDEGHSVYIISPCERRLGIRGGLIESEGVHILSVKTLNIQKTNIIEKGIGTLLLERQYKTAIKKYLRDISFNLIIYSTPPIAYTNILRYLKRKNPTALTYLLLKDIFPQNAVDIGMLSKTGLKGPLYKFFRKKENRLYGISDFIGCMSPSNVSFLLKQNPELSPERIEVAPNSIELKDLKLDTNSKEGVRSMYNLPLDVPVFICGGNLGKPHGIQFLIECLDANANRKDCHFIVIGKGTEQWRIKEWYQERRPASVTVMDILSKEEYGQLIRGCDVGLIFLDHRFTTPNYPSRLLDYLENKMPVLCATDPNTDIGRIAEENGYGYWCESNSVEDFTTILDKMIHSDIKAMGKRGYDYLRDNYQVEKTYQAIVNHLK